jgi:Ulp1 family protease
LQENQWDCGVYLIYYSERFIARPEFFIDPYKDYSEIFDFDDMDMKRERLKNIIDQVKDEVPFNRITP